MKAFNPNCSIASGVTPRNYRRPNKGAVVDMIVLHYTGMPDVEGAIASSAGPAPTCRRLRRAERRSHHPIRAGGRARLACRRVGLGRRDRHQFLFDRHRDRHPVTTGVIRISAPPDRGRDRAVPRHGSPPQRPGASRTGASDVAPGRKGSRRKIPVASLADSGVGHWVRPEPITRGETLQSAPSATRREHADHVAGSARHSRHRQV